MANPGVSTPQFRTLLIRKLGNLYPDWQIEILKHDQSGIAFQMLDESGAIATKVAGIYRHMDGTLTRSNLRRLIKPLAGNLEESSDVT
ncbi:MAG: hypothetical protein IPG54_04535 [Sphingomonadales bacterium]|jgi:hypothetical protein|nr:hypothetical protein [Sphingomonadales bacterium]MBK9002966.1 hypothetical protein [Sphingomonadales bacterium]MBK9268214.1 hypothetical protein [Sphingomonadales bacterium]MBP6434225.1 hypothetical protein [Sphingorhabdus sp.]